MFNRIFVPLDEKQKRALVRYAGAQYRDPRVQAALFIQRGLEAVGALGPDTAITNDTAVTEPAAQAGQPQGVQHDSQ